jgi:hypothetical protein
MNEELLKLANALPEKWAMKAMLILQASMIVGRIGHAIASQGGLKGILSAIWLGTNTPKPPTENKP